MPRDAPFGADVGRLGRSGLSRIVEQMRAKFDPRSGCSALCHNALESIAEGARACFCLLLLDESHGLTIKASLGLVPPEAAQLFAGDLSPAQRSLRTGDPVQTTIGTTTNYIPSKIHCLVVPGVWEDTRLVLVLGKECPFTRAERRTAASAAFITAVALAWTRLATAERILNPFGPRAGGENPLHETHGTLRQEIPPAAQIESVFATASPEDVFKTVIDAAVRSVGASSGVLRLVSGKSLVPAAVSGGAGAQPLMKVTVPIGEGILGKVVQSAVPVIADNPTPQESASAVGEIRSLASVPVLSSTSGRCIASITVHNRLDGRSFTQEDLDLLSAFAARVAPAVEEAWRRSEQRDSAMELAVLHEVATATASLDLEEVLEVAASKVLAVTGADICCFFLKSRVKPEITCALCSGLSERVRQRLQSLRIPINAINDDLWQRLTAGEILTLPDQGATSPVLGRLAQILDVRGAMLIPLAAKGRLIGALYLQNLTGELVFDERQHRVLSSICRQIGVAIENALLFSEAEKRARELSALYRVSQVVASTLNLHELLDLALEETVSVMGADSGSVMLVTPDKDGLRLEVAHGLPQRLVRRTVVPLGEGIAGWVAVHREPLLLGNAIGDPRFKLLANRPEIVSSMSVPLMSGRQVLGVLNITSTSSDRVFTQGDLELATTIAGQLSVAIENAKHFDEESRIAQITRNALMPRKLPSVPGIDIGEKNVQSSQVGGDYYDVFHLDESRIGIAVSDVSGHGIPAAMHAAMGRNYIRALCHDDPSPKRVLSAANSLLLKETPLEVFISLAYAVLDTQEKTLTYANAGHVPPLHVTESGQLTELSGTGLLLGLMEDSDYSETTIKLQKGDVLVFYTDGVTEARRETEQFGLERMGAAVIRNRTRPAQEIAERLYRRVMTFCGGKLRDDIAILVVKIVK
jgi:sigma-B regulation protein RsbU (phosphoserine phosphatase)